MCAELKGGGDISCICTCINISIAFLKQLIFGGLQSKGAARILFD